MEDDRRRRSKWDESDGKDRTEKDYRDRAHNEKESRHSSERDYRDHDRERHREKDLRDKDRERDRDKELDKERERDRDNIDWDRGRSFGVGTARGGSSRWDESASSRRSRSPRSPPSHLSRSRSPSREALSTATRDSKKPSDPAAAAAAAAARINAQLQAKRGVQNKPDDITYKPATTGKTTNMSTPMLNGDIYMADGDYIKDIEVNDLRNRYTLTKGSTQKMIKEETGADVTTRGAYYPDKAMATPQNPPLYLHVTSTTKEGLEKAIEKIEHLMKQELGSLVDERRFRRREPPEPVERDEYGRRKWPEERVYVGLEPIPGFNLRASVVGHQGMYVKHIQQETRCRVQIKGRGSSFLENGRESDEPMYLHVTGPDPREVQNAKELCEDLIKSVKDQYEQHKNQPPSARFQNYGHQNTGTYASHSSHGNQKLPAQVPNRTSPQPPQRSPPQAQPPAPVTATQNMDYSNTNHYHPYAGYNANDPYAAYGGYQAYAAYYAQYYAQQQQQQPQQQPTTLSGPPGASSNPGNTYAAVKPPPGL